VHLQGSLEVGRNGFPSLEAEVESVGVCILFFAKLKLGIFLHYERSLQIDLI